MEQRDPLAVEKEKILKSASQEKKPGYKLIAFLVFLVSLSLLGTYINSSNNRTRSKAALKANCIKGDATNRVLVEIIGELTAPRQLGPSSTPEQVAAQEEANKKAAENREKKIAMLRTLQCDRLGEVFSPSL